MSFNPEVLKNIEEKLTKLGWAEEAGPLAVDLNDLVEASNEFLQVIQEFQVMDARDEDTVLHVLSELQAEMLHFEFHIKSALPMVEKLLDQIEFTPKNTLDEN